MGFFQRLDAAIARSGSRLCIGLDPDPARMPLPDAAAFLGEIIAATHDIACCYKPNLAFFEAMGDEGFAALHATLRAMPSGTLVIGDAKRGDIGNTAEAYARAMFDRWGFDCVTVNPYGGGDSIAPFTAYTEKGVFVWCRGSNPGAADFQEMLVHDGHGEPRPLYEVVALRARAWNANGNVGLVAGATVPAQIARLRTLCPELPFLLPGVGAQGGAIEEAVRDARGGGYIINASRGVLYAGSGPDFAAAARAEAIRLRDAINRAEDAAVRV